jgi:hypothetical protein
MPQKKKLMTCEEKQLWEILPSLLLGHKVNFRWPKKKKKGPQRYTVTCQEWMAVLQTSWK